MNALTNCEKTAKILKNANLRQTKQRQTVLKVLLESENPISQDQITTRLNGPAKAAPNKVTVYRILECLRKKNIIHKAFTKNRTDFYELANNCSKTQCHPHFTCTKCHKTLCIKNAKIPIAEIADQGFQVKHQKVELEGICPECSEK